MLGKPLFDALRERACRVGRVTLEGAGLFAVRVGSRYDVALHGFGDEASAVDEYLTDTLPIVDREGIEADAVLEHLLLQIPEGRRRAREDLEERRAGVKRYYLGRRGEIDLSRR
jgi:hypothetical protein